MDEDQEICRVCRSESTPDHPLYHPCKCSGSIRFVHEDCLIEWLSHSKKKYCELCEYPFTFSPIYRDDMPERVPLYVLFTQLLYRFFSLLKTGLRGLTVVIVWLIVLPNFTLWTWRFYFWSGENIGFYTTANTTTVIEETFQLRNFFTDCLEGQVITAFVIIIFVAAYLFREWVMQNLPAAHEPVVNRAENNNNVLMEQQEAIDTLLNAMQVLNPPEDTINQQLHQLRAEVREEIDAENDEVEEEMPYDEWYNSVTDRLMRNDDDRDLFGGSSRQNDDRELFGGSSRQDIPVWESGRWDQGDWGDDDEEEDIPELVDPPEREEEIRRQRDIIAEFERNLMQNRQERQQAAADIDEPLDVGDDINGVLEAIGMRGNPWILVQNSVLMSLMISLCLGVAVWIPYVVGRLVIMIRPVTFIETPIYLMRLVTDPLVDFVLDLCVPFVWSKMGDTVLSVIPEPIQIAVQQAQQHVASAFETAVIAAKNETVEPPMMIRAGLDSNSSMMHMDWTMIQNKVEVASSIALARWHQFAMGRTGLDRGVCILVGYLVLIGLGSWYLTHSKRREGGTATTGETIRDIILQQGIFLKVLFFILIELVIFPTVCGFLLDMSTLPLFEHATFGSRYAFHVKSPYASYFLHWFLGTGVLFYFATFITVCREIIRPGVMWFIRDPNDPQFHPVQEMVERPLPNLLHKISQSALVYSVMLVFGVGTVTYSLAYTGVVFPLRLFLDVPLSTWAIDLLTVQFLLPPLMKILKPRDYSKKALDFWWHFACRQLRLTSFMFNKQEPDEEGRHVRRTLKAFLFQEKAPVVDSEVELLDENAPVVFKRDGMMVRVPKYDSVPVDPKRRMIVPVDPITHEAIDEEERRQGHPAAADTVDESQATIVVYIPPHFKQRIILFLLYMWFTLSVSACSVTVVPLLIGRFVFNHYLAPGSRVNDLYSFNLGVYIMTGIGYGVYLIREMRQNDEIQQLIIDNTRKVAKFLYLTLTLGILIPLLAGIVVDLFVFLPFRLTPETGFVIHVSQNWSFGVAYMSIIHNTIHVLPTNNPVRQKLIGIFGDNNTIMQADLIHITRAFIVPVIISALLAVFIPAILSWLILQMLDSKDSITVMKYTYPSICGVFVIILVGFSIRKLFQLWMETVRDDTYLIGRRLHNMQTNPASTTTA